MIDLRGISTNWIKNQLCPSIIGFQDCGLCSEYKKKIQPFESALKSHLLYMAFSIPQGPARQRNEIVVTYCTVESFLQI
jgi:hypothetical protein